MTTNRRPQAIVDALVARCAEVLGLEPAAVIADQRGIAAAAGRAACWQVLHEVGWPLHDIAPPFARHYSTIHAGIARSERLAAADADHAYLVTELRRVIRETTRADGFANIEARVRAQLWAFDQEIAAATVLRDQLDSRIGRVQRLRAQLAYSLSDIAVTEEVITRGDRRQLQEVSA